MNTTRIGLLVAALCAFPALAHAQKDAGDKGKAETKAEGKADEKAAAPEEDLTGEGGGDAGKKGGGTEEPQSAVCELDPDACKQVESIEKTKERPLPEQLYAVQQIFALRIRRFELNPYWAFTLNDQFVSHPGFGLNLNYYISNVLAVGLNGNFYRPFNVDSAFNADVRRAARVGVPLTEYDWSAALNVSYVPAYGKFSGFNDFIFQYDAYLTGGVGAISTRPIPVIDPDNRNFDFEPKVSFNAGVGLRIFFNRWFAAMLEVRDFIFLDKLEALVKDADPANKALWFQKDQALTNHVQAQVGFSFFLPPAFDYRLPK